MLTVIKFHQTPKSGQLKLEVILYKLRVYSISRNGQLIVYVSIRQNAELLKVYCGPLHLPHVTVQPAGKQLVKKLSFQPLLNTIVYTLADYVLKIRK